MFQTQNIKSRPSIRIALHACMPLWKKLRELTKLIQKCNHWTYKVSFLSLRNTICHHIRLWEPKCLSSRFVADADIFRMSKLSQNISDLDVLKPIFTNIYLILFSEFRVYAYRKYERPRIESGISPESELPNWPTKDC